MAPKYSDVGVAILDAVWIISYLEQLEIPWAQRAAGSILDLFPSW